jgi:Trm5-related predicted tRNA methylase
MPRMFVEQKCPASESPREAVSRLMHELDITAAQAGQRVVGDVTIMEYESPLEITRHLRLEADVTPT